MKGFAYLGYEESERYCRVVQYNSPRTCLFLVCIIRVEGVKCPAIILNPDVYVYI